MTSAARMRRGWHRAGEPVMRRRRLFRRRMATRGFSLIEVVVAAGIFALIAGVLFGALWTGRSHLARFERSGSDQERLLALRRILTSHIEAATVAGMGQEPGATVFTGAGDLVVFNATPADRGQAGGLYRVELAIEPTDDSRRPGSRVILRRTALGGDAAPVEATELILLPRQLAFRYSQGAGSADWSETWADATKLPARFQLADLDGPLLTIRIAQSKDPRCVLRRGAQTLAGGECLVR